MVSQPRLSWVGRREPAPPGAHPRPLGSKPVGSRACTASGKRPSGRGRLRERLPHTVPYPGWLVSVDRARAQAPRWHAPCRCHGGGPGPRPGPVQALSLSRCSPALLLGDARQQPWAQGLQEAGSISLPIPCSPLSLKATPTHRPGGRPPCRAFGQGFLSRAMSSQDGRLDRVRGPRLGARRARVCPEAPHPALLPA